MLLKKKKSEFAGKLSFEENHVHIFNLKCEFGHLQLVLGRHLLAVHNQNHFGLVLHYRQVLPKWLLSGIQRKFHISVVVLQPDCRQCFPRADCFLPDFSQCCQSFTFMSTKRIPPTLSQVPLKKEKINFYNLKKKRHFHLVFILVMIKWASWPNYIKLGFLYLGFLFEEKVLDILVVHSVK